MGWLEFTVIGRPITQGSKQAYVMGPVFGGIREFRAVVKDASNKKTTTERAGRLDRWRESVAEAAEIAMAGATPWDGPIDLDLEFVLERPKSHWKKSGGLTKSAPRHHVSMPDRCKLARAVEDAMTGIVYKDDSQVCAGETRKRYIAVRGAYPGVIVKVRRVT